MCNVYVAFVSSLVHWYKCICLSYIFQVIEVKYFYKICFYEFSFEILRDFMQV
jgi:hypothetical protein